MVREALGAQFQRSMPEYLDGLITVASVRMSPDLRIAKVYVSIYRSTTKPEILMKRLNTHAPEIRKRLGDDVEMKHLPELRFFLDDTLDTVERIDKLLKSVREEDEAREAERAARAGETAGETAADSAADGAADGAATDGAATDGAASDAASDAADGSHGDRMTGSGAHDDDR
jgi:ribosome-binding factor A